MAELSRSTAPSFAIVAKRRGLLFPGKGDDLADELVGHRVGEGSKNRRWRGENEPGPADHILPVPFGSPPGGLGMESVAGVGRS